MSDEPNKPLLSDEQVVRLEDLNGSKMTPFEVRNIYEAERAKDRELIQALVNRIYYTHITHPQDTDAMARYYANGGMTAHDALKFAAERGYKPTQDEQG